MAEINGQGWTHEPENEPADTSGDEPHLNHADLTHPLAVNPSSAPLFTVGDRICISKQPPYFKTADSMPMLRPPDTIPVGTEGRIMGSRPGGYWVVRFARGTFLIDSQYIQTMPFSSDF